MTLAGAPRVEVEWVDSLGLGGWRPKPDVLDEFTPGALRHRTVGYLVRQDDAGVVLAASYSEDWDDKIADSIFIPKQAVLKVTQLVTSE